MLNGIWMIKIIPGSCKVSCRQVNVSLHEKANEAYNDQSVR